MALTASHQTKRASYRQRRMGPAPFASLEDLSDDQDSPPPGNNGSRLTVLPGIKEDSLQMPATPRIDISRASSSSHQDSNNSSPERELFAGSGEGGMKLGLGFKEEGAADLRSSTEELDFTDDPIGENRQRRDSQRSLRKRSGSVSKYELEAQSEKERKDSLSIISTGRTSRLSSIGSAASAASSAASHLSVASSGGRSPSPHKMLLETSFCGSKPLVPQASIELDEVPGAKEALNQADPTAVIAGDLHQHIRRSSSSASRHRRGTEDTILIMPNVTAVVSPAERELLAAKEKALQEEVQRELENRRAERPPATLNLKGGPDAPPRSISGTPSASPKPTRHHTSMAVSDSRTPSPCSVSRKHSFASLFRRGGGETTPSSVMSPESPIKRNKSGSFTTILGEGFRERSRSRSKSRERAANSADGPVTATALDAKGRKDSKNKSVFSSLFKKKERKRGSKTNVADSELSSPEPKVSGIIEPMGNVEFTFNSEITVQPVAPPTNSSACNVIHRNERRGSSDEKVTENASEHRRSNSSKRMGIHEEQLLPSESVMLPGMPQDLADVLTVSGVRDNDTWWKRESSVESKEHLETKTEIHCVPQDKIKEPITKSEESIKDENMDSSSVNIIPVSQSSEPSAEVQSVSVSVEPVHSLEEDRISSGSERDSEIDFVQAKVDTEAVAAVEDDHERKGLVLQQDSFEDELPYVPTTLPQERSIAVPIIPVKQRVTQEVKTCPIERPRSTTPINPSLLEEYVQQGNTGESGTDGDKMRIQLPKTGSISDDAGSIKARSPWRIAGVGRSWFEFAEQGSGLQQSPREYRKPSLPASSPSPPPLPPRAPQPPLPQQSKQWINFEDIPEKRKPAKRIQTIPTRVGSDQHPHPVVYSYVNPEDCKCECHEAAGGKARQQTKQNGETHDKKVSDPATQSANSSNKLEVNENTDRNSYLSDSSYEYPNSYGNDPVDYSDGLKPTKPFGMDLDVSSNRSSVISQDETQSPEIGSPNGLKQ